MLGSKQDVAILGGGVAGLSAAFELEQLGVDFVLLEASNWPGGQIRTDRTDGFVIELGADGLALQNTSTKQLIEQLNLTDRMVSQNQAAVFALDGSSRTLLGQGEAAKMLGFKNVASEGVTELVTFETGMSALPEAIVGRLPGERMRFEAPVNSITRGRGLYRIEFGHGRAQLARALIVAVPAREIARLFSVLDRPTADRFAHINPVSSVSVSLAYPAAALPNPLDGSGVIVHPMGDQVGLRAITYVSQKFPCHTPEGWVLFRAFYRPGGSRPIDKPDEVWMRAGARDVARILGVTDQPPRSWVSRWPDALYRYDAATLHEIQLTRERLTNREPIEIAGAACDGDGVERAIASARDAVHRLLSGLPSAMTRKAAT